MKFFTSLSEEIVRQKRDLYNFGLQVPSPDWQGQKVNQTMREIDNVTFRTEIPITKKSLADECNADLPWAEDHFQERIKGEPLNPGDSYNRWPFYKKDSFKEVDGELFSHTYMERFFPSFAGDTSELNGPRKGIRYEYGDLEDIIQLLRTNPDTRQAFLSVWHPEDQSNKPERRKPCTIGYWFRVINGRLDITYLIRSCDAIRHFHNDMYLTGRLAQYVSERISVTTGLMTVWIGSLHCFESDLYTLKKQIK